ncbi:MAG: cyclic nucleotide-binding/CBS domain-containing protein [Nitrososphaeraceae archaeon]
MSEDMNGNFPVKEILSKNIVGLDSKKTTLDVAKLMTQKKISAVAVTKNQNKIVGIITERDLVKEICAKNILSISVNAENVMSSPLQHINKNSSIINAAKIMTKKRIRHLAVVDEKDEILGIITSTDIIRFFKKKLLSDKIDKNLINVIEMTEMPLEEGGFSLPLDEDEFKQ